MPLLVFPLFVLAAVLLIVALPVLAPVLAWLQVRDRRRLHLAAEAACCTRCGHRLGRAALEAADGAWRAELTEMRALFRHGIPRIVRHVYARCTACGADHGWEERSRTFPLLPVRLEQTLSHER